MLQFDDFSASFSISLLRDFAHSDLMHDINSFLNINAIRANTMRNTIATTIPMTAPIDRVEEPLVDSVSTAASTVGCVVSFVETCCCWLPASISIPVKTMSNPAHASFVRE